MDLADLSVVDILCFISEELRQSYSNNNDKVKVFEEFLAGWEDTKDKNIAKVKANSFEFEPDLDWFNVSRPLSLAGLRGKVVVIDFFTYCCINCMHVLPELRALEERFPIETGLVVLGVHSPKFKNEHSTENILSAAQRYGIVHPILNDSRSALWRSIGIRCWPSLLVLSPSGFPIMLLMGEGHGEFLQQFVRVALSYYGRQQTIDHCSLPLQVSESLQPASSLRFPAKIARSGLGRYAIADAGNHRILIVSSSGVVESKIGGIEPGFVDGDLSAARFNSPQGVVFLDEDTLIVADTENHALRQISLKQLLVQTLAGTGQQGHERMGGRTGPLQPISSPWDVAVFRTRDMDMSFHLDEQNVPEKTIILIAMAGTHQIWGYFPEETIWWKFRKFEPKCCVSLIGSGHEENRNNSYPQNAAFAQPSGLAMAKDFLFIADSESSSIRKASMLDGKVVAVVGGDRNPQNLFAFGDIDGKLFNAKLQHPLGVAYNHVNNHVYVADTYNHKIKVIDTETSTVTTLAIKDANDQPAIFKEPAGLCVDSSGKHLFVADTNNHNIYTIDLETLTRKRFTLDFSQIAATVETETDAPADVGTKLLKIIPLLRHKSSCINFTIILAKNLKFTEEAPQKWVIKSLSPGLETKQPSGILTKGKFSIQLQRSTTAVPLPDLSPLIVECALNLCDAKCCLVKRFSVVLNAPREQLASGSGSLNVDLAVHIGQTNITLS